MDLPKLNDPVTWSVIVGALALVLSQFPPILPKVWTRFRGSNLSISTQDSLALTHHLGRVYLLLHLQIHNAGSATVSVSRLDCVLVKKASGARPTASRTCHLPARTYLSAHTEYQSGSGAATLFVGTITLKPEDSWQEVVRCYGPRSETDEESAQTIVSQVARDIYEKLDARRTSGSEERGYVMVDDDIVTRAREFFERMFDLEKGEYDLYVAALDRLNQPMAVAKLRFVLYESSIEAFRDITDDFKFGFGIVEQPPPYRMTAMEPRLTFVGEGEAIKSEYLSMR